MPYKNGVPSDDTLRRFFRAIDPKDFQNRFVSWVKDFQSTTGNIISIDGKTSRHSFDGDKSALHMVSAFASEARIVLGQEKVSDKSNEITAIPQLLKFLDLKGAIVTIDAMGCQHKIADEIIAKDGEYILALKGNQGSLQDDVRLFFEDQELAKQFHVKEYEDVDCGHGRIETRKCYVTEKTNWLKSAHKNWKSICSIVKIHSTREFKNTKTTETRYYISSLPADPKKILSAVRKHWAIENSLHWLLDMSFGDDQSRIRKENAPENIAVCRHIALNMIQKFKTRYRRQSIKRIRKMAGWDDNILASIISTHFS